ncbi:MAG: spore germination protein GerW family protein [Acidimicrobiia bacterium]
MANDSLETVLGRLDAVKDTMTVSRVFGEAYLVDGVTVIPVAAVRGGGGGGGGEGDAPGDQGSGSGGGVGFGVTARPVGVYVVKDGTVSWQPSVDVMRIILGGQILGFFALLTLRRLLSRR